MGGSPQEYVDGPLECDSLEVFSMLPSPGLLEDRHQVSSLTITLRSLAWGMACLWKE